MVSGEDLYNLVLAVCRRTIASTLAGCLAASAMETSFAALDVAWDSGDPVAIRRAVAEACEAIARA